MWSKCSTSNLVDNQSVHFNVLSKSQLDRLFAAVLEVLERTGAEIHNEDPMAAISKGELRRDIYYRLSVVNIEIPALKERPGDIPLLVAHFIENSNKVMGKKIKGISEDVLNIFKKYSWPGNVRELHHTIEHAMNMADSDETALELHHLQTHFRQKFIPNTPSYEISAGEDLKTILLNIERNIIVEELVKNNKNITQTARNLGMSRQHLQYRLKRLHIDLNE